ncbi:MAG: hypothetical protein EOR12_27040 [Mesorhizobium sp.]|uniref:hypothetical protein n=1 Tax=Mesorhizobium sp. TaxID=1871066 RepID=UPI000FE7682E|nr:hypothetical protein [Mesorhizobium sp.]RWP84890.1 MAG: hypothetical protein EOR12_27040 [Mesorhizobium sp.]
MADYAGAKAAIRARFDTGWTTTRKTYQNEDPAEPWPPVRPSGSPAPWTQLRIRDRGSEIWTFGTAGNRGWRYDGDIIVHVFTPVGEGTTQGDQYAVTIGELFRAAEFYKDGLGSYIRTLAPEIIGGDDAAKSEDGKWFGITMTVEFTYWHRG